MSARRATLKRRKAKGGVLVPVALVVLIVILFPVSLGRELTARPVWAIDLREVQVPYLDPEPLETVGFRLGDRIGYAALDGQLKLLQRVIYGAALSDGGFINFSRIPGSLVLQNPDGELVRSFSQCGYPAFDESGDRLFVFYTDATGLKEITLEGQELWRIEFPSVITSFHSNGSRRLIGLANGGLALIDSSGAVLHRTTPDGSRVPVILGCSVGSSGGRIAAVSGIGPQKAVIFRIRGDELKEERSIELASSYRREVFGRFSHDEQLLYFEQPGGIGVLDVPSGGIDLLPMEGTLTGFCELGDRRIVLLISEQKGRSVLRGYCRIGHLLFEETLAEGPSVIRTLESGILLGAGGRLMRIDVAEG